MISTVGFLIFAVSLSISVFTSNLFISAKEKSLAKKFKVQRKSNVTIDFEARHAHTSLIIANVTRVLMVAGLILAIVGYFFD